MELYWLRFGWICIVSDGCKSNYVAKSLKGIFLQTDWLLPKEFENGFWKEICTWEFDIKLISNVWNKYFWEAILVWNTFRVACQKHNGIFSV